MGGIVTALTSLVNPVAKIFTKRTDRKINQDSLKAKVAMSKEGSATEITLTDGEWEELSKRSEDNTWKDEYVTIVITSPIVLILLGSVYASFTGNDMLLVGTVEGINALVALGVDMEFLMNTVVLAAVGLKVWRKA